jgi:hypothetical protein
VYDDGSRCHEVGIKSNLNSGVQGEHTRDKG